MSKFLHKVFLVVGFLSLFHAAFSAAQHRSFLRLNEEEFTGLPTDIVIQAIISLFIVTAMTVSLVGEFKEIRATVEMQKLTWENSYNNPSFYTFSHRGKVFSKHYRPPATKAILED